MSNYTILSEEQVETIKELNINRDGKLELVQLCLSHEQLRLDLELVKNDLDYASFIINERDQEIERLLARIVELESK